MYPVKKNILQVVALLKAYSIEHIVLSPGSRNAPLLQAFSQDPYFKCQVIVDERNAAFHAIGIMQKIQKPVAVCCTSGTALLNYAPAVAEAYYQQLPLIVLSADRSPEWIGQMDGQTVPQANVFGSFVKKSVHIPEIQNDNDEWYCNRLINEALISATKNEHGPVHINIPISEPLFDYSVTQLPSVRRIHAPMVKKSVDIHPFADKWNRAKRRMIIVGQQFESEELTKRLEELSEKSDCIILTEHISNCVSPLFVSNFDTLLSVAPMEVKEALKPDLVINFGGHIVSKQLKHVLRANTPHEHWHLSQSGEVVDLFQSLTQAIETDTIDFLSQLATSINQETIHAYNNLWHKYSQCIHEPENDTVLTDITITGDFLKQLPKGASLHLANSSVIRNAQLYKLDESIEVYCNRGTNGIESSLPSAIGFASVSDAPTYLVIGDLSFFYAVNALWNIDHIQNLRILLINNGGGGIFHQLPKLNESASIDKYVAAGHNISAKKWAEAANIDYRSVKEINELKKNIIDFTDHKSTKSIMLEIQTHISNNKHYMLYYNEKLKNIF